MHRSMKRLDQAVRYVSPWISVGLALALLVVWLRPDASLTQARQGIALVLGIARNYGIFHHEYLAPRFLQL